MSKPQAGRPRSEGNQVGIPELYKQCAADEKSSTGVDWGELKLLFVQHWITAQHLFRPLPKIDGSSPLNTKVDRKIHRLIWEGAKYRRILELVRNQPTREDRLLLLAQWLCEEQACKKLDDIVELQELQRLAKQKFACFSPMDFHHADRVRSWLPYFNRLLADSRTATRRTAELEKLGYEARAILAIGRKRSAIAVACEGLAACGDAELDTDALTLRNAYSRLYGRITAQTSQGSLTSKKRPFIDRHKIPS